MSGAQDDSFGSDGFYRRQQQPQNRPYTITPTIAFDSNSTGNCRSAWGFRRITEEEQQYPFLNEQSSMLYNNNARSDSLDPNYQQNRFVLPAPASAYPSSLLHNLSSNDNNLPQQIQQQQTTIRPSSQHQLPETTTPQRHHDIVLSKQPRITKSTSPTPTNTALAKTASPQQPIRVVSTENTIQHESIWSYLGIILRKPNNKTDQPWGMSVSLFDNTFLVLGHVNHTITKSLTIWTKILSKPPPASNVFFNSHEKNSKQFQSQLEQLSSHVHGTNDNDSSPSPYLLPGDIILSLNGRSIVSFGSLNAVTKYLQKSHEISIIVSRHKVASEQALAVWFAQKTNWTKQERMSLAAKAAYRIIQSSLGPGRKGIQAKQQRQYKSKTLHGQQSLHAQAISNTTKRSLLPAIVASTKSSSSLSQQLLVQKRDYPIITKDFHLWLKYKKGIWRKTNRKTLGKITIVPSQKLHSASSYAPIRWRNPLFCDGKTGEPILYSDNDEFEWEDGLRAKQFIVPIRSFPIWLAQRKATWRKSWKHNVIKSSYSPSDPLLQQYHSSMFRWTNPLFRDEQTRQPLPYSDNEEFEWEDGLRAKQFIVPIYSLPDWLSQRKKLWRKSWNVYKFSNDKSDGDPSSGDEDESDDEDESSIKVSHDFWTSQGYASFDMWLAASTTKWKLSYSWNKRKRKRIEQECEEIVHFPATEAHEIWNDHKEAQLTKWLRVRKNQWRMMRRKRQRRRKEEEVEAIVAAENSKETCTTEVESHASNLTHPIGLSESSPMASCLDHKSPYKVVALSHSNDMLQIDALLEEQERQRRALEERPPFDISFIFDANLGAPDDVVAHCFSFLHRSEHGKLLCISKKTSKKIKERDYLWRTLCPPHWVLPRRPRKPWHQMYITRIREEEEASRKRSDELLNKVVSSLHKGDQLLKVQKLIKDGQKRFGFDINYVSGVLFERNSLLNLAVINCRHRVVKWLIEAKDADLESDDRGGFTPLLNAAWEGDKHMVRYLMGRGADRTKIGTGHYSRPLAPPDFKGLTAEGWARRRGHDDLADLIRLGL